jgi:hypothetical protein
MPRHIAVALFFAALLGLSWWANVERLSGEVAQASAVSGKEALFKPVNSAKEVQAARPAAKSSGPLSVEIRLLGEAPKAIGDVYELEAVLLSHMDLAEVKARWFLAGSSLVSGVMEEKLNLLSEEEKTVRIRLRAEKPGAQRVQFQASSSVKGASFTGQARYSSQPDLFEVPADAVEGKKPKILH